MYYRSFFMPVPDMEFPQIDKILVKQSQLGQVECVLFVYLFHKREKVHDLGCKFLINNVLECLNLSKYKEL